MMTVATPLFVFCGSALSDRLQELIDAGGEAHQLLFAGIAGESGQCCAHGSDLRIGERRRRICQRFEKLRVGQVGAHAAATGKPDLETAGVMLRQFGVRAGSAVQICHGAYIFGGLSTARLLHCHQRRSKPSPV